MILLWLHVRGTIKFWRKRLLAPLIQLKTQIWLECCTSPEHSGVNLPNVSVPGNLSADRESHVDAEPAAAAKPQRVLKYASYACVLRVNLPGGGDGYVTDKKQCICEPLIMSMSEFERENFHPPNSTPDRTCTAYFNVGDNLTIVKDIFDALL